GKNPVGHLVGWSVYYSANLRGIRHAAALIRDAPSARAVLGRRAGVTPGPGGLAQGRSQKGRGQVSDKPWDGGFGLLGRGLVRTLLSCEVVRLLEPGGSYIRRHFWFHSLQPGQFVRGRRRRVGLTGRLQGLLCVRLESLTYGLEHGVEQVHALTQGQV